MKLEVTDYDVLTHKVWVKLSNGTAGNITKYTLVAYLVGYIPGHSDYLYCKRETGLKIVIPMVFNHCEVYEFEQLYQGKKLEQLLTKFINHEWQRPTTVNTGDTGTGIGPADWPQWWQRKA